MRVGPNPTWLVSLKEEDQGCADREKAMWGHCKETAICKPRRKTSGGTSPANTLILDVQPSELWENKFWSFEPPSLWRFVMTTVANKSASLDVVHTCSLASELPPQKNPLIPSLSYSPQTSPNAHFTPAFVSLFLLPSVVQLFIAYIRWATLAILAFAHLILSRIRDSSKFKAFLRERERGYEDDHNRLPWLQTLRW